MDSFWSQTGPLIALAVFVSLALGVILASRLVSRWNRDRRVHDATASVEIVTPPPIPPDARLPARRAPVSTGVLAAVGTADTPPAGISPVLLQAAADVDREARKQDDRPRTDHLDTTVSAMACPECRRQYDIGGDFCPRDGAKLQIIETDHIAEDDEEMVCSICERDHPAAAVFCDDDGGRLAPVLSRTRQTNFVPVAIPFCPTCHREHPPELTLCPDDGAVLIKMLGRRSCGHPLLGVGPKRKICPDCGLRYAADLTFCTRERTKLVSLN